LFSCPSFSGRVLPPEDRVRILRNKRGKAKAVEGKLGKVGPLKKGHEKAFKKKAKSRLKVIAKDKMGGSGEEDFVPRSTVQDKEGNTHIRFKQKIGGIEVDGASMVMHVDPAGAVTAVNGELVDEGEIEGGAPLDCEEAFQVALEQSSIDEGVWITECVLTIVATKDGSAYKAWKRMMEYTREADGSTRKDELFASVSTGDLVAVHPQIHGALAMQTYDCKNSDLCSLVETTPGLVERADEVIENGHNHAFRTYNYFLEKFGRDSLDGNGMTIKSFVHVGTNINNAYWDGANKHLIYGDGDGECHA